MKSRSLIKSTFGNTAYAVPRVTPIQWLLVIVSAILGVVSNEIVAYNWLAIITQACVILNLLVLVLVTIEALRTRVVGKCCLVAAVFVFFWLDASALAAQTPAFAIPEGYPIKATQFSQQLIQRALLYVNLFQLCLFVGYSLRPKFDRPIAFLASRVDALSFDRSVLAMLLIVCAVLPLATYYNFDFDKIIAALLASRSAIDFDSPEPGLTQHLAMFGVYGASLFFVYALRSNAWRRLWWLFLGVIAALPFISGGTRHIWLYISLPCLLVILRGFNNESQKQYRVFGLTLAVLVVLIVAQLQFAYRTVGWTNVGNASVSDLTQVNSNGHFTALLFAEHLVPHDHSYFMEPMEIYFVVHWIPRQIWPNKPVMESWNYYNESYVQGASFNVTPSVIGQFHLNWGLPGVIFIGLWLGFLTLQADRLLVRLDAQRQRAMFVVVGMFYAFVISSFRFYSPIYFSYFVFGLVAMFLLTRRRLHLGVPFLQPRQIPV